MRVALELQVRVCSVMLSDNPSGKRFKHTFAATQSHT